MIDLHTHIIPDWDDGARSLAETVEMCRLAAEDGVEAVVFTPHIFRMTKYGDNFNLLARRVALLLERIDELPVKVYPGAEIFLGPDIIPKIRDFGLSINRSNYVFIEFPSESIPPATKELLYRLMLAGFLPIISHPERNLVLAERPEILYDLVKMGCFAQVTALSLTGGFGPEVRKAAEKFLRHRLVQLIASDAHNARERAPRLSLAVKKAGKILDPETALAMVVEVPRVVLESKAIPDMGEPENPKKRGRFFSAGPLAAVLPHPLPSSGLLLSCYFFFTLFFPLVPSAVIFIFSFLKIFLDLPFVICLS